ncbi:solute carrier family 31 (copper transporter), member 1, partial [Phenoliferia sp. Uapishka_3]
MAMLWNTDTKGICLVFPQLQITGTPSLIFYLIFSTQLSHPLALHGHTGTHTPFIIVILLSASSELLRSQISSADKTLRTSLRSQLGIGLPTSSSRDNGSTTPRIPTPIPSNTRRPSVFLQPNGGGASEEAGLLGGPAASSRAVGGIILLPWTVQSKRSAVYAAWVAISSYLMLILMSYNAQLIAAVIIGAGIGHFVATRNFDLYANPRDEERIGACH